ncbi:3'-5' RNA helicase YTHDC2-like isoform X1 [Watersipora subatra]|uniref:3'-5' RNA helicase YTHDC2-like isoform X1 n=1 Tax=Watersipora subatra TaxID=2589382 RepID=UPI00355B16DE
MASPTASASPAVRYPHLASHALHSPLPRPESVGSVHSAASDSASSTRSFGRGPKPGQDICVSEQLKIAVDLAFDRFKSASPDTYQELEFPSSLTSTERAYIHRLAAANNFKSRSRGKNSNRYITVIRPQATDTVEFIHLEMTLNSQQQMLALHKYPLTNKEKHDLMPRNEKSQISQDLNDLGKVTTGKLNNGLPQVPMRRGQPSGHIPRLPIEDQRAAIVHTIASNQTVLISGETGCGKTTQVPQMILDSCADSRLPCRIICTQPRRLAALSVAERVAYERGEVVGQTVGYQIRLESKVSPKTLLTYCTTGVLLRTLIGGDNCLATVTHIVVDELHERDKLCDFLLIVLRQAVAQFKNLKVVLMSATLNTELFLQYFNNSPILQVPGSLFDVEEYYLEDVLKITGYMTRKMKECKLQLEKVARAEGRLPVVLDADETEHGIMHRMDEENIATAEGEVQSLCLEDSGSDEVDPVVAREMDRLIGDIWMTGDPSLFSQIYHFILSENVSADFQHSETGVTPLMAACSRGLLEQAEQLINLGANVHFQAIQARCSALDIAIKFHHEECVDLLQSYVAGDDNEIPGEPASHELSSHDSILLDAYHHSFDDEKVDLDLVVALAKHIMQTTESTGALLVFLPGYDDIVSLRDMLAADTLNFDKNRAIVFTLHSNLQTSDQKKVFQRPPNGVRKIILSTNIAETSITVDDIVYVIDCGKVKEKSFDAFSNISTLRCNWISRASSTQRAGRAGRCRPGIAYHLFSSSRYKSLAPFQVAEIIRSPLQELCLHTKLLAPCGVGIADFLSQAPEPPSFLITRNAVQLLKQMDALDSFEDLTELGHHLVDMPIEPRLGKMIVYSVILKCLDPILTIACTLAYKEPFMLPSNPSLKRTAAKVKEKFSADSQSDHMSYLRVFQAWQRARSDGYERSFCQKNFVSTATMEMILGMRSLLLGQLRASGFVKARGSGDIRDLNTNSDSWPVVKAALCAGIYPNLVKVDRNKAELKTLQESKVRLHQTSVLSHSLGKTSGSSKKEAIDALSTDWLIYEELCRSQFTSFTPRSFATASARCATVVTPITVFLFAGPSRLPLDNESRTQSTSELSSDSEEETASPDSKMMTVCIDNWLKFKVDSNLGNTVLHLRNKWNSLLLRKLSSPGRQLSANDDLVIRTLVNVLTSEEQSYGLKQPSGIGQRPRPMSTMEGCTYGDSDKPQADKESRFTKGHQTKGRHGSASNNSSNRSSPSSSRISSSTNSPCQSPGVMAPLSRQGQLQSCRYFVVRCQHTHTLDLSYSKGLWAASSHTAAKLSAALNESQAVFIIFMLEDRGFFQGVATVSRQASPDFLSNFREPGLSTAYFVNWVRRANIPFTQTQSLNNRWASGHQMVSQSPDGQELEPTVGEMLVRLWDSSTISPNSDCSQVTILQRSSHGY